MSTTNIHTTPLPPTYRALQFHSSSSPATIVTKTSPSLPPPLGTALVRPLQASIVGYSNEIFQNGNPRGYAYPLPFVPGPSCIGRLVAVPSDAPGLKPGQLVLVDAMIRARDQEADGAAFLLGFHGGMGASRSIMDNAWRDGTYAELAMVPVENVHVLDENILFGQLGYKMEDLGALMTLAVAFGGLDTAKLRPGETVIIAPATGSFGGAAVHVALALGAQVIAMGRNKAVLAELEVLGEGKIATAPLSGTVEGDLESIKTAATKLGSRRVDVFFEISPPKTVNEPGQTVPHITAALTALRKGGRAVFMGGIKEQVNVPLWEVVHGLKTLLGWWMYTAQQLNALIHLVEAGVLKLGDRRGFMCKGIFPLEKWDEAFDLAAREAKAGAFVLLQPTPD
ncbi:hypothetical protein N0V93_007606 [Gnomoniopsis smithogilvyi]|uniref:Alcohol dehydrogenase n=1 Tax=Gnomoniopsis smithogilvyi TaxID=1191159 RepID=A0A9W8YQC7_9PEZI|nr:hypothetical protein N0V93_007606 [Gnomoniopsis smithogilvyi]